MNKALRRTESLVDIQPREPSPIQHMDVTETPLACRDITCVEAFMSAHATRCNKEQRERKKGPLSRRRSVDTAVQIATYIPSHSLPIPPSPDSRMPPFKPRTSSPLGPRPQRFAQAPRNVFPRSKQEPDLLRIAVKACMGEKLYIDPRLAVSVLSATRELEQIVASQTLSDADEVMKDATESSMGNSWIFVPGEDWEIVDCAA